MKVHTECPAKVNLFLAVGPRDSKGYHPLRTVFQAISLTDTLTVTDECSKTEIVCNWPRLPERNTVTKALNLLTELVALPPLRIELTKRIPVQSGLGGGSSDAAGLLRIAQRFADVTLQNRDLMDIAQAVGADIPFFVVGGLAKAEGYGEILTPLEDRPEEWMIVARPDVDCPTAEAYSQLDRQQYRWLDWSEMEEPYNDFERIAPVPCRNLITQLNTLGVQRTMLSGSGSAVFGLTKNRIEAEHIRGLLAEGQIQSWVVKTLKRIDCLQITSK
jgi:4-diphosphocytidyl-2-C-methyl-D-erythritol kinase